MQILCGKVDTLIRLVACGLIGGKTQREKIDLLCGAGLQPKEVAGLIGTTPNTVRVELSAIKKGKKKRKRNY